MPLHTNFFAEVKRNLKSLFFTKLSVASLCSSASVCVVTMEVIQIYTGKVRCYSGSKIV